MQERKKIKAKEILSEIKNGVDNRTLMQKYNLTSAQLQTVLKKLINAKVLEPTELQNRFAKKSSVKTDHLEREQPKYSEIVTPEDISNNPISKGHYTESSAVTEQGAHQGLQLGKIRFVLTPWLLNFITFGIYGLVWLYKIHDEMLNHTGDQSISPGKAIGFLFIPIFNIFWVFYILFHVPGLIKNMDMNDDVPMGSQTNAGMIGIIGLVPVVNLLWAPLIQNALNRHWRRHANETR